MVMPRVAPTEQKWLDRLTRTDELVEDLIAAIQNLDRDIRITLPATGRGLPDQEKAQKLLQGDERSAWQRTFAMDTAETDKEILVDGDFIHAWTDGVLDGVYIKPNNKSIDHNIYYFKRRNPIKMQFQKFFLTYTAQAGKTLDIMVGREASSEGTTSEVTVSTAQYFNTLRSDKDTHFTGGINQNAKEDENLTGLIGNKIRIVGISLQSDQSLDYRVIFWKSDGFDNTDLDLDRYCGEIEVDLPTYGYRIAGANQYYLDVRLAAGIDYEDEDASNELHISVMNLSATAKNAGATGEVIVEVYYEPRS